MPMDAAEARQWIDRWKEVDEHSLRELRKLSLEQKLIQLSSLMRSATLFTNFEQDQQQDRVVMDRWMLLRSRLLDHSS